jgi:hypothetical protein
MPQMAQIPQIKSWKSLISVISVISVIRGSDSFYHQKKGWPSNISTTAFMAFCGWGCDL